MTHDDEIATLERECATAMLRGDESACAAVLSDDFTMIEVIEDQPVQVVLKDDWLKRIKAHDSEAIEVDDVAVSMHGDVAIATVKLTHSGMLTSHQIAITDVWRKEQAWRLVERHQSRALAKP
ncbi:MAG TPA: nuclear transport factor 2 family protein [Vicinamibacterales bacterium]|nr:nuclear transport factor 2 family protein [Vicinamibacterales bacterium]